MVYCKLIFVFMYFVYIGYNNNLYLNRYFVLVLMDLIVFRYKVVVFLWIIDIILLLIICW